MFNSKIIVIVCAICIVSATSGPLDSIAKCSIKDNDCMKNSLQNFIISISESGIPEHGILPIDPMIVKDVKVSILGMIDLTLIEGKATGVKNCQYSKYTIDIEKGEGSQENICDITVEGKYKLFSDNPLLKELLGDSIRGEGNGKIQLEKIRIFFDYPLSVQKKADGEIYIGIDFKKIKFDYEVLGSVKFSADKLYLGDQEASKQIVDLLNDNWKLVMGSYGRVFVDKAMEFYFQFIGKFYDSVPARYFISDDLTAYIKN